MNETCIFSEDCKRGKHNSRESCWQDGPFPSRYEIESREAHERDEAAIVAGEARYRQSVLGDEA